jgi:DNA-binding NtrC family response regulator/tetratricopeptide (TPR) repeat protein
MGTVFLVRDTYLEKDLALKLLRPARAAAEEIGEIQKEFILLTAIDHPGISRAYDFGYIGGRPFFTRDFVPGESPGPGGRAEPVEDLLLIARDVAGALRFLHENLILHLDVKPGNIVIQRDPSPPRAVLIDFGLCRSGAVACRTGRVKGSLPYMAPEYFDGGPIGPWTDVYAFGVTLYRLATGRFPRSAPAGPSREPAPPPPGRLRKGLPPDLDRAILKCLALDPRSRFRSGGEVLSAIDAAAGAGQQKGGATEGGGARPSGRLSVSTATVGRGEELRRIDLFLDRLLRARAGSPRTSRPGPAALAVTGLPGMGITRFLREVKVRAQTRGIHCYLETGFAGRRGPPGSPLLGLVAHLRPAAAMSRWRDFLARLASPRRAALHASEGERRLRRAAEVALAAGAVAEPVLLVIDDLQFLDEVSLALVIDLVRFLASTGPEKRPPLALVAGFREDGASIPLVRELAEQLDGRKGELIALRPLGLEETLALYRSGGGEDPAGGKASGLSIFSRTGGCPKAIAELFRTGATWSAEGGERRSASGLDRDARLLLSTLEILGRPSTASELSRASGIAGRRAARLLEDLEAKGLAEAGVAGRGGRLWTPGPGARAIEAGLPPGRRRALHLAIARDLARRGARGPEVVEAVNHFRLAAAAGEVVRHGIPAARWLRSTFQDRAALDLLRAVLEAMPSRRVRLRLEIALQLADLRAQVGDVDEGIRVLQDILARSRDLPAPSCRRALLRLATLHARRGDLQRADALFREELPAARTTIPREEVLFFLNEHAMVKAFLGDAPSALRHCEEGLALAGGRPDFRTRELALNLHATRASVSIRSFEYGSAIADLGKALEIAERIGSPVNQALVLNNLGMAFNQTDRYDEAIRAFREAESLCRRLDEGPSLVSIYGNIAVLSCKLGEFAEADRALAEAARSLPAGTGRQQEFLLHHFRGLSLVNRGRYAEAQGHLEAAIRVGEEMGDRYVVAFDSVYRAEGLIFQGKYGEALAELEKLSGGDGNEQTRRMALTRLAFLLALAGRPEAAGRAAEDHEGIRPARPIPFLDSWGALYLAWAASIAGDPQTARRVLAPAESFFRQHRLAPALALASWVKAEALLLENDLDGARAALAGGPPAGNDLTAVLRPLLEARLSLSGSPDAQGVAAAGDLLAEAGARLIGNPLPEWAARIAALRARCRRGGGETGRAAVDRADLDEASALRRALSREVPEEARSGYLRSGHWKAWTAPPESAAGSGAGPRSGGRTARRRREAKETVRGRSGASPTETVAMESGARATVRSRLVIRSRPMRKLALILDRLRGSELPVLICGETGAGKELVARTIHEESPRSGGPFLVIDCSSIPAGLLEAELFGAKAGAFTDRREDHRGILSLASGGTVLVDGVGDAGPELQGKLLRVISEKTLRPLGAEREEAIDVRFIFSASRDLEREAAGGRFRLDLLHRINAVTIVVPPLRERGDDIPELVKTFLEDGAGPAPAVAAAAIDRLRRRRWPGNVRELKNVLARLRLEGPERIDAGAVERVFAEPETTSGIFPRVLLGGQRLEDLHDRLDREYLLFHFRRLGGDTRALWRFLGVGRRGLYKRLRRLGIKLRAEKRKLRR